MPGTGKAAVVLQAIDLDFQMIRGLRSRDGLLSLGISRRTSVRWQRAASIYVRTRK